MSDAVSTEFLSQVLQHLDNVAFRMDSSRTVPVVLDWASAANGPVALDVFPFLATSMSPSDHTTHAAGMVEELADELLRGDLALLVDHGRRALIRHFVGVIGWLSKPPTRTRARPASATPP